MLSNMKKVPKTMKELRQAVMEEINHIKKVATKEELQYLREGYDNLDGTMHEICIYGAFTGSSESGRAKEICKKEFGCKISWSIMQPRELTKGNILTAMEVYLFWKQDMIHTVADYILGRTQHLKLK